MFEEIDLSGAVREFVYLGPLYRVRRSRMGLLLNRISVHSTYSGLESGTPLEDGLPAYGQIQIEGRAFESLTPLAERGDPFEPFEALLAGQRVLVAEWFPMADVYIAYPDSYLGNLDFISHITANARSRAFWAMARFIRSEVTQAVEIGGKTWLNLGRLTLSA